MLKPSLHSTGSSSVPSHISHAADQGRTPLLLITNHTSHLSFSVCEGMSLLCEGQSYQVVSGLCPLLSPQTFYLDLTCPLSQLTTHNHCFTVLIFLPSVLLIHLCWLHRSCSARTKQQQLPIQQKQSHFHLIHPLTRILSKYIHRAVTVCLAVWDTGRSTQAEQG